MNQTQKIKLIEAKINEIKTLLTYWTQKLTEYKNSLTHLTKQLTEIKSKIKNG